MSKIERAVAAAEVADPDESSTSAWRRETVASGMQRSQSGAEPITHVPAVSFNVVRVAGVITRKIAPRGRGGGRETIGEVACSGVREATLAA